MPPSVQAVVTVNPETTASVRLIARLTPLTPEAESALDYRTDVCLERFPARVGREHRARGGLARLLGLTDRRGSQAPTNDLYLHDDEPIKHVSRDHLHIERRGDEFWVTDRGSACGTVVGERYIGGDRQTESARINDGSVLIVGSPSSPFVFRFNAERTA